MNKKEILYILIILLNILIIRFFIIEPFRIPSGSMMPTLLPGDFILVSKFSFGIKNPINKKDIIKTNTPERGDIIVFKNKDNKNYIKRVIGIPGDKIELKDKNIYINKNIIKKKNIYTDIILEKKNVLFEIDVFKEFISPKKEFKIQEYKNIQKIKYNIEKIKIPEKYYFVLGDNRDNSEDSRFWGLVKYDDLVGKALIIWLNIDFDNFFIKTNRIIKIIK